jgi:hypothetical protein
MKLDFTYLKKRAQMTDDFDDAKVQAALAKLAPPPLAAEAGPADGYECVVGNKLLRNWVDLVPEGWRGFMSFSYEDGDDAGIDKYLCAAMTGPAWKSFQSAVSREPDGEDLFLSRWLVWYSAVLRRPVGIDFGVYEMNQIFNALPVDVAARKTRMAAPDFAGFYRAVMHALWSLADAD